MDIWSYGGLIVAFTLMLLLVANLLANSYGSPRARAISEVLNVSVSVFGAAFVVVVLFRIIILLG